MNTRITQAMAKELSDLICDPKQIALRDQETEMKNKIQELYLKTIPASMLQQYKIHPTYFRIGRTFLCDLHNYHFHLKGPECNGSYMRIRDFNEVDRNVIEKLLFSYHKDKDNLKKKREELYLAILSFKNTNRLKENFPEAFNLIPSHYLQKSGTNLPAVKIDLLREFVTEKPSAVKSTTNKKIIVNSFTQFFEIKKITPNITSLF